LIFNMETKKCTKCDVEQPFCNFYKRGDGYKSHCKKCSGIYYKKYYVNNKEKHNETMKNHYLNNIDLYKKNRTKYKKENYEKLKQQNNKYIKDRRKSDLLFRLKTNMRTRIWSFLKTKKLIKNNTTIHIIGCTPIFLKEYIETLFTEGMNWENYGEWHIDHIIPLSSAKTEDEIYELCYYTNLQPLWSMDNIKKSNKHI